MKFCVAMLSVAMLSACSQETRPPAESGSTRPVPTESAAVSEESFKNGPKLPIASGTYVFQHRSAEHPSLESIELKVIIEDRRVRVINERASDVFEKGVLEQGYLLWHPRTRQWIIAKRDADQNEFDVGGCSGGPEVIDLVGRVYWTC